MSPRHPPRPGSRNCDHVGEPSSRTDAVREIENLSASRQLSAEKRLQLEEAVEHFADGAVLLTALPGHRDYARRAA